MVAVRYSAALAGGVDEVTIMLLDVLSTLDELKICVAYELDGQRITDFPADAFLLERCRPVYETLPGWKSDISAVRKPERSAGAGEALYRPDRGAGTIAGEHRVGGAGP